jgi:hypothetical protein
MKTLKPLTYVLSKNCDGSVSLYKTQAPAPKRTVPPVIEVVEGLPEFCTMAAMQSVAVALVLDWLDGEADAERKAIALSAGLGRKLWTLGARRQQLFKNGRKGIVLSSDELEAMVGDILVTAGEMAQGATEKQARIVEYVGQRRDLLRAATLQEATSRLLN